MQEFGGRDQVQEFYMLRRRRKHLAHLFFTIVVLPVALFGVSPDPRAGAAPPAKGNRTLTIDVNAAADGDFDAAFKLALGAGMDEAGLTLDWNTLEPESGRYLDDLPTIANVYYPAYGIPLHLSINPVSTNVDTRPADLQGLPHDDPRVIERYLRLLDHVFALMPDVELGSLLIGLEVDASFGNDRARWNAYSRFVAETSAYARSLRPGLRIGVETQVSGRLSLTTRLFRGIDAKSDLIAVSHYPLAADFAARNPAAIGADLKRLLKRVPKNKPIHFNQIGYPSSDLLGSSERAQATFVRKVFAAWDVHADRIERMEFVWLHDVSAADVAAIEAYYGFSDPRFAAFLGTLGLRSHDGSDKPAFVALREEAAVRGWGG